MMQYNPPVTVEQEIADDLLAVDRSFASRMFNRELAALRAQNPFLVIDQFPGVISCKLTANVAQDINIPDGTKMVRFRGNGQYLITRNGVATIPSLPFSGQTDGSGCIIKPEGNWYFTGDEIKQLSIIAIADMVVSMEYIQQQ